MKNKTNNKTEKKRRMTHRSWFDSIDDWNDTEYWLYVSFVLLLGVLTLVLGMIALVKSSRKPLFTPWYIHLLLILFLGPFSIITSAIEIDAHRKAEVSPPVSTQSQEQQRQRQKTKK